MKRIRGYAIEINHAMDQVLLWFFAYPEAEMGLNELAQAVGIAKTTANEAVRALVNVGYLELKRLGKLWRIKCTNTPRIQVMKIAYNLRKIYDAGIVEETYKLYPNAQAVVLFGSYRKGDDTEKSDVDIAVEIIGDEPAVAKELGIISELSYRTNVKVNLFVFSRNKVDLNMFANIANGIVLSGFLEVRP